MTVFGYWFMMIYFIIAIISNIIISGKHGQPRGNYNATENILNVILLFVFILMVQGVI